MTATAGCEGGVDSRGRCRLWAYFESQAAISASWSATFSMAKAHEGGLRRMGCVAEVSMSMSFQRCAGDQKSQ